MWKGGVRIRDGEGERDRQRQRGGGKTRMRVRKVGKSEKRKGSQGPKERWSPVSKSCSLDTESFHERDAPEQACTKPAGKHCSSVLEAKRWQRPD